MDRHCISVATFFFFFIRDYGNESMNIDDAYNNNNPKQIQTNPQITQIGFDDGKRIQHNTIHAHIH